MVFLSMALRDLCLPSLCEIITPCSHPLRFSLFRSVRRNKNLINGIQKSGAVRIFPAGWIRKGMNRICNDVEYIGHLIFLRHPLLPGFQVGIPPNLVYPLMGIFGVS
jgi:hypothetical protein